MIEYLIKSSACLLIFFLFYRLVLERQSNHVFKRFYLLGSLLAGLGIPLLILGEKVISLAPETEGLVGALPDPEIGDALIATSPAENGKVLTYEHLLNPNFWEAFYFIGLLVFGAYFIWNLAFLLHKIYHNQRLPETKHTKVLLKQPEPPHTFLRFIFLGQQAFKDNNIPESVLEHEQTHIDEKHSLDVLLVECLRLIFWFQPLVWVYSRAIRLNHEFLADRKVLSKGYSTLDYQHALLAFAQNKNQPALSHAIHYSSIKKRIQVMKTNTSKRRKGLALLMLAPLIAFTLFSFSSRKIVTQEVENPALAKYIESLETGVLEYSENSEVKEIFAASDDILDKRYRRYANTLLKPLTSQEKRAIELLDSIHSAHKPEKISESGYAIPMYSVKKIGENATQDSATREEMKEYNALAKKYNAMIENGHIKIYSKEVDRMKYIYGKMSEKQRLDAEPFPDFPQPPPGALKLDKLDYPDPPKYPETPQPASGSKKAMSATVPAPAAPAYPATPPTATSPESKSKGKSKARSKGMSSTVAVTPPPPPPPPGATRISSTSPGAKMPPPPPPPPTMEEILAELKEMGIMETGKFYMNGKAITAKEAHDILTNGKANSVEMKQTKRGISEVRLKSN